jgi:hypothetical protein
LPNPKDLADFINTPKPIYIGLTALFAIGIVELNLKVASSKSYLTVHYL